MFRVQYDTYAPDTTIDADEWTTHEDFVTFTKEGEFVAAVKTMSVLTIHRVEEPATAGPFRAEA